MKSLTAILALCLLASGASAESISERVIQTVAMEASNQSAYGQFLVASVIVNRAVEGRQSLEAVCMARKQFSAWNSPKWAKAWLGSYYTTKARLEAKKAIERAITGPYQGINHYHTTAIRPYWAKGRKPLIIEGNHAFYKL